MNGMRAVAAAVSIALVVSGCATASHNISASYVSRNQYAGYDCQQLAAEAGRIQTRVVQLGGRLDQAAQNDAGIMAVSLILNLYVAYYASHLPIVRPREHHGRIAITLKFQSPVPADSGLRSDVRLACVG